MKNREEIKKKLDAKKEALRLVQLRMDNLVEHIKRFPGQPFEVGRLLALLTAIGQECNKLSREVSDLEYEYQMGLAA